MSAHIHLAHGGGGQLGDELLREMILPRLGNASLNELLDSATLQASGDERIAMTIDGYVVQPTFFPGGDIGRLAVCGTINDLAVCGARPIGLALGMILEEGTSCALVERVMDSVAQSAQEASVEVVTGDTKVVGRGAGDGIYLTTAGVGLVPIACALHPKRCQPGDAVLVSGAIADHGLAVMLAREMPEVNSHVRSDVAPLHRMIAALLRELGDDVRFLRDPTRAGLAGVCADLAERSGCSVVLQEAAIPVRPATRQAADFLGLDPLEVANEGKVVAIVRAAAVERALDCLREHPYGRDAAHIGELIRPESQVHARCEVATRIGGRRLLAKPYGELLPRIC
jgi:hydrogenase expression/formation protein HypE